jgi:PAS domain S-box-containing protein
MDISRNYPDRSDIFKILIEQAPIPVALYTGAEIRIALANQAMLTKWGKDETVIGKTLVEVLPEPEGQRLLEIAAYVFTSGVAHEVKNNRAELIVNGELKTFYFDYFFKPLKEDDGDVWGILNTATDVTETVLMRSQLEESKFVTEFMPQQVWTATPDGMLDFVNRQIKEYFKKESEALLGPKWQDVVHPDDLAAAGEAWRQSLETGSVYQTQFRLKGSDDAYRWHLARAVPFIVNGQIMKWVGTNTDIDEQKQLQRQKDEFLGIASHELKTPVTSIKAYAQVLGAMLIKEGEKKKAEMILRMDAQINRLTNLIGDLLDVTKINSGKLQFNKTWFDFNDAVKETVEDLQHTTQKHRLVTDFAETGSIHADRDRIGQVLTNLITNAIKYSPFADRIIIKTSMNNDHVEVCVQDFGIGIPPDKKDKVFEQFYRVSGTKQHTFPGLGLGLYISSEIIKREGGRIWVDSVEGKGSTFCFILPVNNLRADHD